MNIIKKIFFNIKFTWLKVIIFSIISGVLTGAICLIPRIRGTVFFRPAETLEMWVLLALVIILNCKKALEAAIKTFIFFLISQPLVYLVQVPFASMSWGLFGYYKNWFIITLFTFPGAYIAWYVKAQKTYSVFILGIADLILLYCMEIDKVFALFVDFSVLSAINTLILVAFIFFEIILFTHIIFENKKLRAMSLCLNIALIVGFYGFYGYDLFIKEQVCFVPTVTHGPYEIVDNYQSSKYRITNGTTIALYYKKGAAIKEFSETFKYKDGEGDIYEVVVEGRGEFISSYIN